MGGSQGEALTLRVSRALAEAAGRPEGAALAGLLRDVLACLHDVQAMRRSQRLLCGGRPSGAETGPAALKVAAHAASALQRRVDGWLADGVPPA